MIIKENKNILFVDLTKIYKIKDFNNYDDKNLKIMFWDNNKNEYDYYLLELKDNVDIEKAINGLFMAIQRGAKTVDLDKYIKE